MHKHLTEQHGEEDPTRFHLQRDPTFATLSPPRTYTSGPPVIVNPTMFDRFLRDSMAMRRAVEASTEARHQALRQTVLGGFTSTPEGPSISYATRDPATSLLLRSSFGHRGTVPELPHPSTMSVAPPPGTYIRLPAGAPTSATMH